MIIITLLQIITLNKSIINNKIHQINFNEIIKSIHQINFNEIFKTKFVKLINLLSSSNQIYLRYIMKLKINENNQKI